jgi:hypothetical protein
MRYQPNDKSVVSEVLDGEVIVIHLTSGTYYSMQASAADVWIALAGGWSVEAIVDRLAADEAGERPRIDAEIARFVAELVEEDLVLPVETETGAPVTDFQPQGNYASPELQKYTDMQDWMLVDPIHEVTEEGWPIRGTDKT